MQITVSINFNVSIKFALSICLEEFSKHPYGRVYFLKTKSCEQVLLNLMRNFFSETFFLILKEYLLCIRQKF